MGFTLDIDVPLGRRSRKATIVVKDDAGKTVHTDKVDLHDPKERQKAAARIAEKVGQEPAAVAERLEAEWNERVGRLRISEEGSENESAGSANSGTTGTTGIRSREYAVEGGNICRRKFIGELVVSEPLCNFSAAIIEEVSYDDGSGETQHTFVLGGSLADGTPLPPAVVSAKDFPAMNWLTPDWGARAIVRAGLGAKDHLRAAIQELSQGRTVRRTVHRHSGWRQIDGRWVYLHAGGGIAAVGLVTDVSVNLGGRLADYRLPAPPDGTALAQAVRASLDLRHAAPPRVTIPLLGAVYRSVLCKADCSLFLVGTTGLGKSELAALAVQHFGPAMNRLNLPANWSSTANALESLAFLAKDTLLPIDDFKPGGSKYELDQWHAKAERVLRAQGNASARQRCRPDGTLGPERPPRGFILATGEDLPRGESLQARNLPLPIRKGDIHLPSLTPYQQDAGDGVYAAAMAGYLRWLAARYDKVLTSLPQERAALRTKALSGHLHPRVPGVVADLALGWKYFLDFALEAGAITPDERTEIATQVWDNLLAAAAVQTSEIEARDAARRYIELLMAAIASGRAHLTGANGQEPVDPGAWGWKLAAHAGPDGETHECWRCQGHCVGWVDNDHVYLDPEACYAEAQRLAEEQGERIGLTQNQLHRKLKEQGLLASTEKDRATVRRQHLGRDRAVVHLYKATLLSQKPVVSGFPVQGPQQAEGFAPDTAPGLNGHAQKARGRTGGETPGNTAPPPEPPELPVSPRGAGVPVDDDGAAAGGGADGPEEGEL
jgi:hypothetical protein